MRLDIEDWRGYDLLVIATLFIFGGSNTLNQNEMSEETFPESCRCIGEVVKSKSVQSKNDSFPMCFNVSSGYLSLEEEEIILTSTRLTIAYGTDRLTH
jgi:hypothetical protein